MAGKGASRTATKRVASPSRARSGGVARKASPVPRKKKTSVNVFAPVTALWNGLARMIGGAARVVGRNAATAAELDPAHRRDGLALLLLGFGIVTSVAVWFHRAGAFGEALTLGLRFLIGSGAMVIPLISLVGAIHMMRQAPDESQRGRIMVGAVTLSAGVLGLLHLGRSSPDTPGGGEGGGGSRVRSIARISGSDAPAKSSGRLTSR